MKNWPEFKEGGKGRQSPAEASVGAVGLGWQGSQTWTCPAPLALSLLTPKCGWQASGRVQDGSLQVRGPLGSPSSSCPAPGWPILEQEAGHMSEAAAAGHLGPPPLLC